jgi:prophage maintenance system killer protein
MVPCLNLNGYAFYQTDEAIEQTFVDLGSDAIRQDEFFRWACNHAKKEADLRC